jgi:hypothetical protein
MARAQHPSGCWTDFWVPVGASDAWVTAYVGLAFQAASVCPSLDRRTRARALDRASRAAQWLLDQPRPRSGWGYNAGVWPDADTTAHALTLLAQLRIAAPEDAVTFLRGHAAPEGGFRTYNRQDSEHQWARPCSDVSAAALRALYDLGELQQPDLRDAWHAMLAPSQDEQGWWPGYWWLTPNYTTGLVLEVWHLAGQPPLPRPIAEGLPETNAFDRAWGILAYSYAGNHDRGVELAAQMIGMQAADGGWPSAPILRIPPSHIRAGTVNRTLLAHDARRLFATASAVRALACATGQVQESRTRPFPLAAKSSVLSRRNERPSPTRGSRGRKLPVERSRLGRQLDQLVEQAAAALGFTSQGAALARDVFGVLTHESLAAPCPWPAPQLSVLADGTPLEFSATVGNGIGPALRYATEVGVPWLAPHERARTGVAAVARAAELLGYEQAWQRVAAALEHVVHPQLPAPDGLRFWVWSGVDQLAPAGNGVQPPPGLKIYVNLLHHEVGRARQRLEAALRAADIPLPDDLIAMLDMLDAAGFLHEFGFGLGPSGKIACKVYYDLHGWRRALTRQLLERSGLPDNADAICPEIPGIIRESLAAKSRAGIALRIDTTSGRVRELTTAAAFPPPLIPLAETHKRVAAWIDSQAWDGSAYHALTSLLLPSWSEQGHCQMHSLFTRTISQDATWSAVYIRPLKI